MTYEYECESCGKEFEAERRITDESDQPCPSCGQTAKRLVGGGGFVLSGGCWTKDGFAKGGKITVY